MRHNANYVDYIFQSSPERGLISLDPDTWMNTCTLQAALRAAGSVVHAVDLVMKNDVKSAFCNVRPPGHHAEHATAMGFCFFNNIAVGVAHALEHHGLKRVAIIDFDVHHGNGTEDIFRKDERVMLCSSFQHPFYPNVGADTKSDHILNTPLPAGTNGKDYFDKVITQWVPAVTKFEPEMIFSAGFDGDEEDILANLNLQTEDYARITKQFKQIADKFCQGRMVSALEGGYSLDVLGLSVVAHIRAMMGGT